MLNCRDAVGAVVFEDEPLRFNLKISKGAESFWNVQGLLFAKLNFLIGMIVPGPDQNC